MKIVVLGAGALGSILAAQLARAGEDVALIARGPRAEQLARGGVRLRGLSEERVDVEIVQRPQDLSACDVFVLTAKTYDTDAALESVRNLKPELAFSVQNGVVKDDRLVAAFGAAHVAGCIANFSGEVAEDGAVRFTRNEGLYIGELPQGVSARVQDLVQRLNGAGINTIASDRILAVEWSKYATWMALTAVAVLSRLFTHRLYQDDDLNRLQLALTREGVRLATAAGVEVQDLGGLIMPKTMASASEEECLARLRQAGVSMEANGLTSHRMSAQQDLLRGRRLEIEETYGYAVALAAELGVPAPALEACYRLLAAIDRAGRG